jgi:hypothetical protein
MIRPDIKEFRRMKVGNPKLQRRDDNHVRSLKLSDGVFVDYRFSIFFIPKVLVEGWGAEDYMRESVAVEQIGNLAGVLSMAFRRSYGDPREYITYMVCRKVATPGGELLDD